VKVHKFKLCDLVKITKGKKPTTLINTPNNKAKRFIKIEDLRSNSETQYTIDRNGVQVDEEDICIAWDGANAGTVGYGLEGYIGSTIARLRPLEKKLFFTPYVGRFLQNKFYELNKNTTGATIPHVHKDYLENFEIPLLPIPEQKRIAAILDKAYAISQKRKQIIKFADELLRSIFLDMFGNPVTNPKGLPLGIIRELVSEVKYGTSKKASSDQKQFPIIRMNNITYSGEMNFTDLKYIDLDDKEQENYIARKGDILFNRTNSKELVGKTAVYEKETPMAIAGYLIRVRVNEKANPYYISAYLNSKHGKETLMGMCKNIIGMANINAQEFQDIKILIPPVALQDHYAQIVQKVKQRIKRQLEIAELDTNLFKSLCQRAFRETCNESVLYSVIRIYSPVSFIILL
jgi:type I restriction enzyme S subunit